MFIGVRRQSGEIIVLDKESKAVKYVRTVRRVPEEQRWNQEHLEWVKVVPWNRGKDDPEADGEEP